jgi:hypothetical protein
MPEEKEPPQHPPRPFVNFDEVGLDASLGVKADPIAKSEQKDLQEQRRAEQFRKALHIAKLAILSVVITVVLSVFVIRVLHFVLPDNVAANAGSWIPHCWLTEIQLASMDKFIFGAIGAFMVEYGVKALIGAGRDRNV